MKKTLITLAALAMASGASAATVDFNNLTGASTVTLDTPQWVSGGWDYSTGNVLTLTGVTTIDSAAKTISNGTATVTYTNDVYNLFRQHDTSVTHNGPFMMSAGTINFGTDGSLSVTAQSGGLNLGEMGMKFNLTLDTVIVTDDAALLEKGTEVKTRTFFTAGGSAMWNREGSIAAYTLNVSALSGEETTKLADLTGASAGSWKLTNPSDNSIALEYVVQYVAATTPDTPAVPEPATATLSLLALAGLAARRRRK